MARRADTPLHRRDTALTPVAAGAATHLERPRAHRAHAAAGIAALGGATYALGGAPDVPTEWLDGSPFGDYTVPGLILGGVYAPAGLAAAWAVWRRHPRASEISVAAAVVQLGWIAAQLRVIGFRSFLQPLMGGVGVIDLGLAVRRLARGRGCT